MKTPLAIGLGVKAAHAGNSILFDTASNWIARLTAAHHANRLEAELKKIRRYNSSPSLRWLHPDRPGRCELLAKDRTTSDQPPVRRPPRLAEHSPGFSRFPLRPERLPRSNVPTVSIDPSWLVLGFLSGLLVASVTAPVGVSGAVFLLPIQVSLLGVPSPSVTPTNLLFNLVSIPGALLRYRRDGSLRSPLTTVLIAGTIPGVIIGAVIRIEFVPNQHGFKLLVAAVLAPLGLWLITQTWSTRTRNEHPPTHLPNSSSVVSLALLVGVIGGIYGIGGGSLLSPILVGRGMPTAAVAPAALTSTFITSAVGAATYALLALGTGDSSITPVWTLGLACGAGGLLGGYLGAHYRAALSERLLKTTLGTLAILTATLYIIQAWA